MRRLSSLLPTATTKVILIFGLFLRTDSALEGWPGIWSCVNNRCVYSAISEGANNISPIPISNSSHSVCRLTCGPYGSLWPRPTGPVQLGRDIVVIHPARIRVDLSRIPQQASRKHALGVSPSAILDVAAQAFKASIARICEPFCENRGKAFVVEVICNSTSTVLTWDTNESYKINVFKKGDVVTAQVEAQTVWGARHALETISQFTGTALNVFSGKVFLISGENDMSAWLSLMAAAVALRRGAFAHVYGIGTLHFYSFKDFLNTVVSLRACPSVVNEPSSMQPDVLVAVKKAKIFDAPKYSHRGVLLDTARHYLPLSALLRTVDAMASVKLNVLHWHATDSHSFPVVFPSAPHMARLGAYSSQEVYTPAAIAHLLRYARLRGVRVIMEIDIPSHCGAGWMWGPQAGLGDLVLCAGKQPWRQFCLQPPCGQLNPVNPAVVEVLRNLYRDVMAMWPSDSPMHMGGDEVSFPCWNSSSEVVAALISRDKDRSVASFVDLWGGFQKSALEALDREAKRAGRQQPDIILWSSHLTRSPYLKKFLPPSRYVIQTWTKSQDKLPQELLALGYRVILSFWNSWYLDHGWRDNTVYHPWGYIRDQKLPSNRSVLGGEAALWGELVDASSLDSKLWPRASAVAERLWSDPTEPWTSQGVTARFAAATARLVLLGIKPEPVQPQWCQLHEDDCS